MTVRCALYDGGAQVVYGADGQGWSGVATALKRGKVADGEVTLVLERLVSVDMLS